MPFDPENDIGETALEVAALDLPGLSLDRYSFHLKKNAQDTAQRHAALIQAGANDDAGTQLAALKYVLHDTQGYTADPERPGSPENSNLIRVIDRRKGSAAALGLLYIDAGCAQGWDVAGLDFPGYFLCRIEKDGQRLIFDPGDPLRLLGAPGLRALLKKSRGEKAELSAMFFEPLGRRALLIRLWNEIKFRRIEDEDYDGALRVVDIMRRIDPAEYRLLLDAGVLYARTGQPGEAIAVLESYIRQAASPQDRYEAELLLRELRESAR